MQVFRRLCLPFERKAIRDTWDFTF